MDVDILRPYLAAVFPPPAPVLYILGCLQTAIVICTTPRGSIFRIAYSLWLVYTAYWFNVKVNEYCADCIQKLYISLFTVVQTVHSINLLVIIGLEGSTVPYRKLSKDHTSIVSRVRAAFEMTLNPRGINTPWQIKNIPPFSPFYGGRPGRGMFVLRQSFVLAWQYLVFDMLLSFTHAKWGGKGDVHISHLTVPDGRLSPQTVLQMVASFLVTHLALDLVYRSLSLFFVALWLSDPTDWPPLFGSMWDSYTLRLFWGSYWHQLLRWPFTTLCSFTSHTILPSSLPSVYARYLTVIFVFTLSGLLHQIGTYTMGISLQESNAYIFFWITAVGLFIEGVIFKSMRRKSTGSDKPQQTASQKSLSSVLWKRMIGYLWTLAWLGPAGSYFMYPIVTVAIVNPSVGVPYSVVERIGEEKAGIVAAIGALVMKVVFKTTSGIDDVFSRGIDKRQKQPSESREAINDYHNHRSDHERIPSPSRKRRTSGGMIELGLSRISRLLQQTTLSWKAIHIAGTNGKGSISTCISHLLSVGGVRCGRFTSPHLVDRWDCITVGEKVVQESLFRRIEEEVKLRDRTLGIGASEFELLTATAFEIFNHEHVDVGVVEVGMGGRLDATNILNDVLVSVISKIGLDHQALLGNTIEQIAREKAGILKPNTPCVIDGTNCPEVIKTLETRIAELGVKGDFVHPDTVDKQSPTLRRIFEKLDLLPHQQANLCCAVSALQLALPQLRPGLDVHTLLPHLSEVGLPGRLQKVALEPLVDRKEPVVLDGAHNPQSAEVLGEYVERKLRSQQQNVTWVVAASRGKDLTGLFGALVKPGDNVVTTAFGPVDGMPWVKATDPAELATCIQSIPGFQQVKAGNDMDVPAAINWACDAANGGPLVIAGSLYLVSDVLRLLREAKGVAA